VRVRPGERVAGRFEILGVAGRGGMGTVFRARDRRDKRDVALKVLAAAALHSIARFELEADILAGLRHPSVVEYVAHGSTPDGTHYLVMEWVEGENLHTRLGRAPLDARETVAMATQLAQALGALHARGVVHRDLKPANVMLVGGLLGVKLVDFGVARRADVGFRLTRTGAMVGTVGYMSPEQVRGVREVDGRADLFALGCILYECLTGQRAFVGETALATRAKVLIHDPAPVRQYAPILPAPLEALVTQLLARDPEARPADAATVERMLRALTDLPAGRGERTIVDSAQTVTSAPTGVLWAAAMVAWQAPAQDTARDDVAAILGPAGTVETIEGGLVLVVPDGLAETATQALAIAARFPHALIAVAAADDATRAIDRAARLVEELELDAATDAALGGVWTDPATAARLGQGFQVVPIGARVRVGGPRYEIEDRPD
jgi:hypothetical protein